MKDKHANILNMDIRDRSDKVGERKLDRFAASIIELMPRTFHGAPKSNVVYIPYDTWTECGGSGNVVPDFVQLVHGLNMVTDDLGNAKVTRRKFMIADLASESGLAPRIHFAKRYKDEGGRVKINTESSYCGCNTKGEGVAVSLNSVTCTECLAELAALNTNH